MRAHVSELKRSRAEWDNVSKALREFSNHVCCKNCCFIVAEANDSGLCKVCTGSSVPIDKITNSLTDVERATVQTRIRSANRTKIRILSEIPNTLRRLWSNCVAATLVKFAEAKTELESFLALEAWVKLKATIVLPLKSGKQRWRITRKFHENQMLKLVAGEQNECW